MCELRLTSHEARLPEEGDDLTNLELKGLCAAKMKKSERCETGSIVYFDDKRRSATPGNTGCAYGASDNGVHALTQFANRCQAGFILIAQGKMK